MPITPLSRGVIELDRTPLFQNTQQLLRRAESEIRLIDRAQPLNIAAEREALIADFGSGKPRAPRFEYAARPALGGLRADLQRAASAIGGFGGPRAAGAARALELDCEAAAAESIATPAFVEVCGRRFPLETSADADAADAWAARWIAGPEDPPSKVHRSDDRSDRSSLLCALEEATQGLPVRV